ncbi:MAG: glycoside hydrolase family 95 protein [Bacteroidales bacterium]|jgi:alpha-L-fucosidase 2|nr:glycoside hydrolase family 95 protein [Bacteroidales bacterium]
MKFQICISLFVAVLLIGCFGEQAIDYRNHSALRMWYDAPAEKWEESLPLGNGRLGMMPDAKIDSETVVLNDITLWSGGVQDAGNPKAAASLPEIRRLLFAGRNDLAQELMYRTFVCGGEGSGHGNGANVPFGSFEILGNLHIDYQYPEGEHHLKNYKRSLLLNDGVARTSFILDNVKYTREYFADFRNDVLVIRIHASDAGALAFSIGIDRPQAFETKTVGNELLMQGRLTNGTDGNGMRYLARAGIKLSGTGKVEASGNQLHVSDAQEALIIISATTDYKDAGFEKKCRELLDKALASEKYVTMKAQHTAAFQELFNRASLTLPSSASGCDTMPTHRRLLAFASNPTDNGLVELYFQYGRYLLISSTRAGLLPPNLQGLWANTIHTPWNGDYHLDINVQMNHWPVEITNLAELHQPLIHLTEDLVESGKGTAKTFYNANGWAAHVITNVWGFTAPGEHPSWGAINTGGAWLCAHLWEHYEYNRDKRYLQRIYPVLKGASEFFLSMLVAEPKHGWLVTAPTNSPENAFFLPGSNKAVSICMGSTMDNQLIRELFEHTVTAATLLETDKDLRGQLQTAATKLPPTRIGSDGRVMEWLEEYEEVEPQHRHVSHLYGLHPGNQITPAGTPNLAQAARETLKRRGDGGTGWSKAWKINFWARLGDGNHAHRMLYNLLNPTFDVNFNYTNSGGTYPNLFCAHPPFQIDGNFGGCAGIAEMFLQSHAGTVDLLPALPDAFPVGAFSGFRARGGLEVSAAWANKQLTSARLEASVDHTFQLKLPKCDKIYSFQINKLAFEPEVENGIYSMTLKKGDILQILSL